jgi:hypothetical protein
MPGANAALENYLRTGGALIAITRVNPIIVLSVLTIEKTS